MKNCRKCSISKNIDDFYKHPKMPDGHLNICKECKKIYSNKRLDILKQDPIWDEKRKKWRSSKRIKGKKTYLGMFKTEIDAYEAYLKAT